MPILHEPPTEPPPDYSPQELARIRNVHSTTIIRMFENVESVIRIPSRNAHKRNIRPFTTMRIPRHTAEREFAKLAVRRNQEAK